MAGLLVVGCLGGGSLAAGADRCPRRGDGRGGRRGRPSFFLTFPSYLSFLSLILLCMNEGKRGSVYLCGGGKDKWEGAIKVGFERGDGDLIPCLASCI